MKNSGDNALVYKNYKCPTYMMKKLSKDTGVVIRNDGLKGGGRTAVGTIFWVSWSCWIPVGFEYYYSKL